MEAYAQVHLYEIVLNDEVIADTIYQKLEAGENFQKLAQTYSNSITAEEGGHIGILNKNNLSAAFANAIQGIILGDIQNLFNCMINTIF